VKRSGSANGEAVLSEHLNMIDREIKKNFENRIFPRPLYDMMKYHLGWLDENLKEAHQYRGKRFRPTLCLLTYNALSGVYDKALPAAAAIELIHNFSLIHDDIEDMDEERRHKPTVWKLWGIAQAINVGDGMHVLANLAALRLKELNVTSSKIVEVLEILNRSIIDLCEGQYLDMCFEDKLDITTKMYLEMISRKTASLVEASTLIGATLATEDEKVVEHFRKFGRNIGTAFQIVDDIIGIWEKKTGKPKASDIRNKKKTLPILYAFEKASKKERRLLVQTFKKEKLSEDDISNVLGVLENVAAYEYSKNIAESYESRGLEELSSTGIENEAMKKLKMLAEFLVKRKY
jgi:geranylgeranyl diphosphate synthase type I